MKHKERKRRQRLTNTLAAIARKQRRRRLLKIYRDNKATPKGMRATLWSSGAAYWRGLWEKLNPEKVGGK